MQEMLYLSTVDNIIFPQKQKRVCQLREIWSMWKKLIFYVEVNYNDSTFIMEVES